MDFIYLLGGAILALFFGGIAGGLLGPVFCPVDTMVKCQQLISYGTAIGLYVIFIFTF